MSITPEQITLVQSTFAQVAPIADQAAALFYNRLFELDPELRHLFTSDMEEQGRKLMQMLAMVVNGLDRFTQLQPAVENLGRRHVAYNVQPEQYETVGRALLWTLEQGLGEGFTDEAREAWTCAYGTLASVMIAASSHAEVGATEVTAAEVTAAEVTAAEVTAGDAY